MRHDLKFKGFKIDSFKSEGEDQLIISGWAAKFGNIDSYGDIIQPGAFTKTINERKERIAFCYQHEIDEPIGKILLLEERPEGLWIEVAISASEGDIQTKIKEGILKEMSIGYSTVNSNMGMVDNKEVTYLTELKLYEVSLVTIAANPLATIEGMKAEEKQGYFESAFERLIVTERNQAKKFELMKLKSEILALIADQPESKATDEEIEPPQVEEVVVEEKEEEVVFTKDYYLNILRA